MEQNGLEKRESLDIKIPKSEIYIYCSKYNRRHDILLCFHYNCRKISKCKELEEVREKIKELYEKKEKESSENGRKKTSERMENGSPRKSQ